MKITLTTLELRILKYASEGKETTETAQHVNLSVKEVESRLANVCKRLNQKKPLDALQQLGKTEFMIMD